MKLPISIFLANFAVLAGSVRSGHISVAENETAWPWPTSNFGGPEEVDMQGKKTIEKKGQTYKCCCRGDVLNAPEQSKKIVCQLIPDSGSTPCRVLTGQKGWRSWNNLGKSMKGLFNNGKYDDLEGYGKCMVHKNDEESRSIGCASAPVMEMVQLTGDLKTYRGCGQGAVKHQHIRWENMVNCPHKDQSGHCMWPGCFAQGGSYGGSLHYCLTCVCKGSTFGTSFPCNEKCCSDECHKLTPEAWQGIGEDGERVPRPQGANGDRGGLHSKSSIGGVIGSLGDDLQRMGLM
jgi:hypothetical protein